MTNIPPVDPNSISFEQVVEPAIDFEEVGETHVIPADDNIVAGIEQALADAGIDRVASFKCHLEMEGDTRLLETYKNAKTGLQCYKGTLHWEFTGENGKTVRISQEKFTTQALPPITFPHVAPLREYRAMTMLEQYAATVGKNIQEQSPTLQHLRQDDSLTIRLNREPLVFLPLLAGAYESHDPKRIYDGHLSANVTWHNRPVHKEDYEKVDTVVNRALRAPHEQARSGLEMRRRRKVKVVGEPMDALRALEETEPSEIMGALNRTEVSKKDYVTRLSRLMWHDFKIGVSHLANEAELKKLQQGEEFDRVMQTLEKSEQVVEQMRRFADQLEEIYSHKKWLRLLQPPALLMAVSGMSYQDKAIWRRPDVVRQLAKSYEEMAEKARTHLT